MVDDGAPKARARWVWSLVAIVGLIAIIATVAVVASRLDDPVADASGAPTIAPATASSKATRVPATTKPTTPPTTSPKPTTPSPTTPPTTPPTTMPPSGSARFPAGVDASGRFLVDQVGEPWALFGDAGWSAVAQLSAADQVKYLDGLQAHGFNLTLLTLVEMSYSSFKPNNSAGENPFTGTMFQSSLNEDYWAAVDAYVDAAASRGITVLATPAYIGYGGDGVASLIESASDDQMRAYGEALGKRYKDRPNIMWMIGGDRTTNDGTLLSRSNAMAQGIDAQDQRHLMTAHTADGVTADSMWGSYPWLDVNAGYFIDIDNMVASNAKAYTDTPTRPVFLVEAIYENERDPVISYRDLRYQAWSAFMTGSIGHIFGNDPRWHFDSGYIFPAPGSWQDSLTKDPLDKGTRQFSRFASFVRASPGWAQTTPDVSDTFLTDGEGSGDEQAAARFSGPAGLGYVYLPNARKVTLDLTEFAGRTSQVTVAKYDPSNGTSTQLGTFPTSGPQTINGLGNNADGDSDWVLVVRPA